MNDQERSQEHDGGGIGFGDNEGSVGGKRRKGRQLAFWGCGDDA
jgi:hypothetical protein